MTLAIAMSANTDVVVTTWLLSTSMTTTMAGEILPFVSSLHFLLMSSCTLWWSWGQRPPRRPSKNVYITLSSRKRVLVNTNHCVIIDLVTHRLILIHPFNITSNDLYKYPVHTVYVFVVATEADSPTFTGHGFSHHLLLRTEALKPGECRKINVF